MAGLVLTLNVVVKGAILVAEFSQEPKGVMVPEVLELDQGVVAVPGEERRQG